MGPNAGIGSLQTTSLGAEEEPTRRRPTAKRTRWPASVVDLAYTGPPGGLRGGEYRCEIPQRLVLHQDRLLVRFHTRKLYRPETSAMTPGSMTKYPTLFRQGIL